MFLSDDELYVYAIELADRKPSKKEKEKAKAITGTLVFFFCNFENAYRCQFDSKRTDLGEQ